MHSVFLACLDRNHKSLWILSCCPSEELPDLALDVSNLQWRIWKTREIFNSNVLKIITKSVESSFLLRAIVEFRFVFRERIDRHLTLATESCNWINNHHKHVDFLLLCSRFCNGRFQTLVCMIHRQYVNRFLGQSEVWLRHHSMKWIQFIFWTSERVYQSIFFTHKNWICQQKGSFEAVDVFIAKNWLWNWRIN